MGISGRKVKTLSYTDGDIIYFTTNKTVKGSDFSSICCIDVKNKELIEDRNWYLDGYGYPCTGGGHARLHLHSLVMGLGDPRRNKLDVIDHINRNPLDARECNLRYASKSENSFNSVPSKTNTSGFKGVSKNTGNSQDKWEAYITKNQKRIRLGKYNTIREAVAARRSAEKIFTAFFGTIFPH